MELLTAVIGGLSLIAVAIVERRTRREDERWDLNTREHETLVSRMEDIGSSLGRSLDRVEINLSVHIARLENKVEKHDDVLFSHLASHAEQETIKTNRKKVKTDERAS